MYIIVRQPKSVGIAILLTILFGPIGLFYASVAGGLIMTFGPICLFIYALFEQGYDFILLAFWAGFIVYVLFGWFICVVWAVMAVNDYNKKLLVNSVTNTALSSDETGIQNNISAVRSEVKSNEIVSVIFSIILGIVIVYVLGYYLYGRNSKQTETIEQWSVQDNAPVYSSPNIKSQIVDQINAGQDIEVLGETKYFTKVKFTKDDKVVYGFVRKPVIKQNL